MIDAFNDEGKLLGVKRMVTTVNIKVLIKTLILLFAKNILTFFVKSNKRFFTIFYIIEC